MNNIKSFLKRPRQVSSVKNLHTLNQNGQSKHSKHIINNLGVPQWHQQLIQKKLHVLVKGI